MAIETLLPQQDRSRKTLANLLSATIQVLDAEGLEACTLPRVAKAAKLSPATVYRRFANKDALLRAAFLHVLQQRNTPGPALEAALLRPTLEDTAARIIAALLQQYRSHPRLLHALTQFLAADTKTPFAAEAQRLIHAHIQSLAAVLLHHRDRIRHPNPQRAALFALLAATATIEMAILEPGSLWHTALPLSDKLFAAELTRSLLGYLRRKP